MTVRTLEEILETDGVLVDLPIGEMSNEIQRKTVARGIMIKGHSHGGRAYEIEGFSQQEDGTWHPVSRSGVTCHIYVYTIYRMVA